MTTKSLIRIKYSTMPSKRGNKGKEKTFKYLSERKIIPIYSGVTSTKWLTS